ncbi:8858_t:CDS:2 [Ambispora leptoticha]|uniref:8858_t:CDS:1 n=1 Tax=Ambispora leptoticha TaxID=144679 RepID=A0A9N9I8K6_9GLOM|nr:8858_t:CDS:2 [Ambispora leptoticha]
MRMFGLTKDFIQSSELSLTGIGSMTNIETGNKTNTKSDEKAVAAIIRKYKGLNNP